MVSVIIPTYNREKKIVASIYSVLNQSYSDIEVLIVDDGSTDGTQAVVQSIVDVDHRVSYYRVDHIGACGARNFGIEVSKGEFIAFNDSDDIWLPDKLQRQIELMERVQADVVVCTFVTENGQFANHWENLDNFQRLTIDDFFPKNYAGTPCLFFRRYVLAAEKFNNRMERFQDYELMIRVSARYFIMFEKVPLVRVCTTGERISSNDSACTRGYLRIINTISRLPISLRDKDKYITIVISIFSKKMRILFGAVRPLLTIRTLNYLITNAIIFMFVHRDCRKMLKISQ